MGLASIVISCIAVSMFFVVGYCIWISIEDAVVFPEDYQEQGNTKNVEYNPFSFIFLIGIGIVSILFYVELHLYNGYHIIRFLDWVKIK
jgi:hypothetical protein